VGASSIKRWKIEHYLVTLVEPLSDVVNIQISLDVIEAMPGSIELLKSNIRFETRT